MTQLHKVRLTVNGKVYEREVEARMTLVDFLRHELHLTGTHVGCEHGVCGACTIIKDGQAVRSCLLLAVQADGTELRTVEGLQGPDGLTRPIRATRRSARRWAETCVAAPATSTSWSRCVTRPPSCVPDAPILPRLATEQTTGSRHA